MQTLSVHWAAIVDLARQFGLNAVGVSDVDLEHAKPALSRWLEAGMHGQMDYMSRHQMLRAEPATLLPGTVRVISVRMNYLPGDTPDHWQTTALNAAEHGKQPYISLYARGRDYHKVLRKQLQLFVDAIEQTIAPMGYRVFCDSAPILEVELASKAGIGWRGKHTLLLDRSAGSMFFLGEILTDLPLELTPATTAHCGACSACIDVCPTQAIVKPYWLDARRCISYLTIEHKGPIPVEFRQAIGTRIYGCDDCQLVCPWNKFAQRNALPDFDERSTWSNPQLITLFEWTEEQFLKNTEGSAIRRIGHERWQRNLAIAMGNVLREESPNSPVATALISSLEKIKIKATELVAEHIDWAMSQAQQHLIKQQP